MNNFIFGLENILFNLELQLASFFRHQLVWGFVLGFSASTFIHLIVVAEEPKHIPSIISKNKNDAFAKLAKRTPKGTYTTSYNDFLREYRRVRIVFFSTVIALLVVILFAFVRF